MKERTLTPEMLRRTGKSLGLPEGADPVAIRKALRARIAELRAPKPKPEVPPFPPEEEQADIQKEIGELYGDEGEEPEAPAGEPVPKPPPAPPAAPAAEADPAKISEMGPEAYFDQSKQWADTEVGPQRRAEAAARAFPDLQKWKQWKAEAEAEAKRIFEAIRANPELLAEHQKEMTGSGMKVQFFSEGIKELEKAKPETIQPKGETPKAPLPSLLEVPKDKGLRGRRAQLVRMIEALSTVDKDGKVIPNDNVDPKRWAQLQQALNDVERQIAAETTKAIETPKAPTIEPPKMDKPVAPVAPPAPSPVAPEKPAGAAPESGRYTADKLRVLEGRLGQLQNARRVALEGDRPAGELHRIDDDIINLERQISRAKAVLARNAPAAPAPVAEVKPSAAEPAPAQPQAPGRPPTSEASAQLAVLRDKLAKAVAMKDGMDATKMKWNSPEHKKLQALNRMIKGLENKIWPLEQKLFQERWIQETAPYRSREAWAAVPRGTRNITAKELEGQKTNLLEQIDGAIKTPTEGKKVTFDIPGDGSWTIDNTPENLKAFKAKIAKEFPKTVPADPTKPPGKASASQPQPAKLGAPEKEDLGKIAGRFNSTDPGRFAITASYSDGTQIIATDGRQLIRISGDTPGAPHAPVRLDANGKQVEAEGNYPHYNQVISAEPNLMLGGVDTKDLFHIVRQAEALRKFANKDKQEGIGVTLYVNPDRSIGAHLKDLGGDSYTHNVKPDAKNMGTYNPEYVLNAIQAARELGNGKVDLYTLGDEPGVGPISFVGKNHESVVMPIRGDATVAKNSAADFRSVAGKPEHRRIPLGLPTLPNPEARFSAPLEGLASQYVMALENGKLSLEHIDKEGRARSVDSFDVKDFPAGKAARKSFLEDRLKALATQTTPGAIPGPGAASVLVKAIESLFSDRNNAAKEVNSRAEKAGGASILFYSGIPIPGAGKAYDAISKAAEAAAHGDWLEPLAKVGKRIRNGWHRFAMQQAPRFTDVNREAGELGVRAAQAPLVGRAKGLLFADKVMTDSGTLKPAADFDLKLGTALTEDNKRDLKAMFERKADEAENREEYAEQAREQIAELAEAVQDRDPAAMKETAQLQRDLRRYESYTDADAADFQEAAEKVTSIIGVKGSPFETEEAYQAFLASPEAKAAIRRHIQRWQEEKDPLYRKANDLDPDAPLETRGLQTGARINLAPILDPAEGTPTTVGALARPGLIRQAATRLRKDRFSLPASGSAKSYEGSYREIMAKGYEHEFPIAAQHEFINKLLYSGLAKLGAKEFPGIEIQGEPVKAYEYKVKNAPKQWIYVPKSLGAEYEDIMGLGPKFRIPYYTRAGEFLTQQSVKGFAEGSTHAANLLMEVFTGAGPTANPMLNALLKSAGRADLFIRIPQVIIGALGDKREAMLDLLEVGAAKEAYRGAGPVTGLINKIDQGVRLNSAAIFDRMAKDGWVENTETNRREFIAQVGNYNKRLQPRLIQMLRDTHIQPFATAQHTFNVMGLRRLGMSPGMKASSNAAALALRADIAAGWLGFAAIVGTLNYMLNGNVTGPPGTRLGAVGWIGDDKRVHQFDVGRLTGFTRGARALGLQGMVEASRQGLNTQAQLEALAQGPGSVSVGMVSGPLNRLATIAATGKRPGFPMVQESDVMPPQTEKNFKLRKTQAVENIATAVREANPLVDFTTGLGNVAMGGEEPDLFRRQFSRYMPTTGPKPETIKALPAIVEQGQLKTYAEAFAREARKQPPLQRMKWVNEKLAKDQVAPELRPRLLRELQKHGVFSRP